MQTLFSPSWLGNRWPIIGWVIIKWSLKKDKKFEIIAHLVLPNIRKENIGFDI